MVDGAREPKSDPEPTGDARKKNLKMLGEIVIYRAVDGGQREFTPGMIVKYDSVTGMADIWLASPHRRQAMQIAYDRDLSKNNTWTYQVDFVKSLDGTAASKTPPKMLATKK